jgi:hypothetical protein
LQMQLSAIELRWTLDGSFRPRWLDPSWTTFD